ncbi:substrate-binding periplasmic protein [Marinobacterium jannaschii]|uniref:substrate-binding periplasmic protein n=1 Tax=Marinobacterium jannaschii TaxID=64970 RepID=UPI000480E692|nr:transporter substrate-binding domain-containing protein [Marinobacterium jannaschii]
MRWLTLALLLVLASSVGASQTAEETQRKPVLIACGHPHYPPVSWTEQGRLNGLAAEVAQRLFAELGYRVKLDGQGNWKRCLREVRDGRADIVVAAYRIPSREPYLEFTRQHLIDDKVAIFINSQRSPYVKQLEDLKGKSVGMLLGDTFGSRFDRFVQQHNKIEFVSKGHQNFAKLALGRIDFMPLGLISGMLQNQRLGYSELIRPLDIEFATEYYYLAIGRNSGLQQHLAQLSLRLSELHRNGEIKRLTRKYSQIYLTSPHTADNHDGEP